MARLLPSVPYNYRNQVVSTTQTVNSTDTHDAVSNYITKVFRYSMLLSQLADASALIRGSVRGAGCVMPWQAWYVRVA
jgi:hypothetical protein